jgi:hypothetical protein
MIMIRDAQFLLAWVVATMSDPIFIGIGDLSASKMPPPTPSQAAPAMTL